MTYQNFTLSTPDGTELVGYKWNHDQPKFIVQIVHGMLDETNYQEIYKNILDWINQRVCQNPKK